MFTFKWLEMMNWDFWSHVRLPMDEQVVLIAGPNGSGKTTLLDAIRVLLNARKLSTSRKMPQYLRDDTGVAIVKAVVTNPLKRGTGKRPFSGRGLFDDEVTLACILERKQGQWQRKYHIVGGDASVEQLKVAPHGLKPEEYSRALEEAQVPRTLLKILALEQGETHKLASRTPEQLLEYVLELQGDKQVLDRYADARSNYLGGQRDLEDFENRLKVMALHVDVLRRDADQYRELQTMLDQEKDLRDVRLPAARLKALVRDRDDVDREQARAEAVLRSADAVLAGFHEEAAGLRDEAQAVRTTIESKRKGYQDLLKEKEKLDGLYRDLKRYEQELAELGPVGAMEGAATELESLKAERERLVAAEASARRELSQFVQKISELRAELATLDTGSKKRSPPEATAQVLRELAREKIDATLVADCIEISDPFWQVAVESVLGNTRFTVLVPPEHELTGRKVGQRLRYRNYVTGYQAPRRIQARANSALSVVTFSDTRVPDHIIQQLDSVQLVQSVDEGHRLGRQTSITPDGYRQDTRGGIFVGTSDLYCGTSAGGHRKAQIESELGKLRQMRDSVEASIAPSSRRVAQIDEQLLGAKVKDKLLLKIGDPVTLLARVAELTEQRKTMSEKLMSTLTEIDADNNQVMDKERRISLLEYRNREAIVERDRARASVGTTAARRLRIQAEIEELQVSVPADLQTDAVRELLEAEVTLIERLNLLRERIGRYEGNRDPRAVQVWERSATELGEHERNLGMQRRELDSGAAELQLARQAYKRVVAETIRRYRLNVLKLGELCRVEVQVKVPGAELLRDESDDMLGKAGLEVRIGFDGKKPVAVDDPKLSGGQSVVASLILLMALTMQEGESAAGFFILDEPFAHLSVERIDEVARFLQVTRAQFIITTPTTHNLLVYNPARLTLNLRKKGGEDRHAPVPTFLRR
jgi:chromosome segregation ATPase